MLIYAETILRCLITLIILLMVSRLIGQKFQSLSGFTIAGIAALYSIDWNSPWQIGILAIAVWTLTLFAIKLISMKSLVFREMINGKPTVLIEQGNILEKNLKKANLPVTDMLALLREKDAFKLADVELGVLEGDGQLSVMKKSSQQPVTSVTMNIPVEEEHSPHAIILDGQIMQKTMQELGLSLGWLLGEIQKQGAQDYADVFFAQVDSKGNVYVDLYKDTLKPEQVKNRSLLLASLKKIQADLESFSLQTENPTTQKSYTIAAMSLQNIIDKTQPYLRE